MDKDRIFKNFLESCIRNNKRYIVMGKDDSIVLYNECPILGPTGIGPRGYEIPSQEIQMDELRNVGISYEDFNLFNEDDIYDVSLERTREDTLDPINIEGINDVKYMASSNDVKMIDQLIDQGYSRIFSYDDGIYPVSDPDVGLLSFKKDTEKIGGGLTYLFHGEYDKLGHPIFRKGIFWLPTEKNLEEEISNHYNLKTILHQEIAVGRFTPWHMKKLAYAVNQGMYLEVCHGDMHVNSAFGCKLDIKKYTSMRASKGRTKFINENEFEMINQYELYAIDVNYFRGIFTDYPRVFINSTPRIGLRILYSVEEHLATEPSSYAYWLANKITESENYFNVFNLLDDITAKTKKIMGPYIISFKVPNEKVYILGTICNIKLIDGQSYQIRINTKDFRKHNDKIAMKNGVRQYHDEESFVITKFERNFHVLSSSINLEIKREYDKYDECDDFQDTFIEWLEDVVLN